MKEIGLLAVVGAIGTLARWGLSGLVQRWTESGFPWGTLAVNLIGCFLFGVIWALAEERMIISGQTRVILLSGFMGAFTTFSSYAFETSALMGDGEWLLAFANVAANNVIGIPLVFLGLALGRLL